GNREDRAFEFVFSLCDEVADTFVRIPKVAKNSNLFLRESRAQRIRFHPARIESLFLKIDTIGRMVGRGHDQIECWLSAGVLEHEVEEMLVVDAPFFVASTHFVTAVNFFESLFAAEFSDALPA